MPLTATAIALSTLGPLPLAVAVAHQATVFGTALLPDGRWVHADQPIRVGAAED